MKSSVVSKLTPHLLSALRSVAAFTFILHGTQKMFGFPGPTPHLPALPTTLVGAAGAIEVLGGGLMFFGLFTRPVAFLLSGEMAVAYVRQHVPRGAWYWPIANGGELAVLYCFLWLFICAAGPGPWSVDALLRKRG